MNQTLALIASLILPLFNVPLIVRIVKRKSSNDVSIIWALGAWTCFLVMLPSGLTSTDVVFKTFSIANFILFTAVTIAVVAYRKRANKTQP